MTKIKAIGIGNCGGHAIYRCKKNELKNIEYLYISTVNSSRKYPLLGDSRKFLLNDATEIQTCFKKDLLFFVEDADILFVIAGVGGDTSAEILEQVSKIANENEILTINVISTPLISDTDYSIKKAEKDIKRLNKLFNNNCILDSEKFYNIFSKYIEKSDSIKSIYEYANEVICRLISCFTYNDESMLGVEKADFKKLFSYKGTMLFSLGLASGENGAISAAEAAIKEEQINAQAVFVSVRGGENLTIHDTKEVGDLVNKKINDKTNVIISVVVDESMPKDEIQVIIIATGC